MKLTIESEWGFEYFIHYEAHDQKIDVVLSEGSGEWSISCYDDPNAYQWIGQGRIGRGEAIKRALAHLDAYLKTKGVYDAHSSKD